ncbi:MAG TPA: 16S rRNA (cytosine(967)-C(5))-methyltransferase RsmB [Bacteroidota bacterium]|nr:16S rRNA (cytosine(967)-C(5))-methyltransferase RsmB [Bacteroidota bacterium]
MEVLEEKKLLFHGVRGSAVKILNRIERTDAYLDKLLDGELRSEDINDLDKALLTEIVNGVLRWQMKLDWVLNGFFHGNFTKAEITVKNALRAALYQIMFLDKIPHHAAVNEAVEFVKRIRGEKAANLVNAVLRNIIRNIDGIHYPDVTIDAAQYLAVMYSHPVWAVRRWMNRFGFSETEKLLQSNNERPTLSLRINTARTSVEKFFELLTNQNVAFERSKYVGNFVRTSNLSDIAHTEIFRKGLFSVQDESAGIACQLLGVQPGDRVIDMCAAPGGKTTYIGEALHNNGVVIAVDKYSTRLNLIKSSCDRLGITNVNFVAADSTEYSTEPADKVLLDAPCSGLGVLAKKPDVKLKRESEDIRDLVKIQSLLAENAAKLVKPGGVFVYSTCTTEPEENFGVMRTFLERHPEFCVESAAAFVPPALVTPDGFVETFPHKHNMDGSFSIRLRKSN